MNTIVANFMLDGGLWLFLSLFEPASKSSGAGTITFFVIGNFTLDLFKPGQGFGIGRKIEVFGGNCSAKIKWNMTLQFCTQKRFFKKKLQITYDKVAAKQISARVMWSVPATYPVGLMKSLTHPITSLTRLFSFSPGAGRPSLKIKGY